MEYTNLKKLYHMNENECNAVYKKRFESDSAHKLDIKINDYECFYIVNEEVLNLISEIYNMNIWIEKTMSHTDFPVTAKDYILVSTLVEEIKSSNKIEGLRSTRQELKELIVSEPPKKYRRFYGMVNKYEKLQKEEFANIETCAQVRKLYDEILLKDVVKENPKDSLDGVYFRKESVAIESGTKCIHKGIQGENNIIEMMDKSLRILNNEKINPLIRIAVFHYLFEYIHPFYNGNGRMGRFIASGYLSKYFNIYCSLQLSIACKHKQKEYYDAFELANDVRNKSDLTPFILSFLEIYLSGLRELQEYIESILYRYKSMKKKINTYVNEDNITLVECLLEVTLFAIDGLTMQQLCKMFNNTEQTIRKRIKMVNKNYKIIKIDDTHKPYKYYVDIDTLSRLENK